MENSAIIWRLMARVLNGEASPTEQAELAEYIRQDESLQQQFDLLSRVWHEDSETLTETENQMATEAAVSRIFSKAETAAATVIELPAASGRRKLWMAAAAVLVLAFSSWFVLARGRGREETGAMAESIEARKGSRSRSLLPDGTTVWLNAGSKIYYDPDFSGNTREVRLEGEAFFDVVKQPDRPFIVHTGTIDIKVLGTAFNVKSYPEDKTVETTLYRGLVQVFRTGAASTKYIQLRPNQKLTLARTVESDAGNVTAATKHVSDDAANIASDFVIHTIDSTKKESERFETAWMYSRLEFRGDNFEDLARKLERWYNVNITFADDEVKRLNFNGSFEQETIAQAFDALKLAAPFSYSVKGHDITVGSVAR